MTFKKSILVAKYICIIHKDDKGKRIINNRLLLYPFNGIKLALINSGIG
jgi:hypothetical protein